MTRSPRMRMFDYLTMFVFSMALLAMSSLARAATVRLSWDPNDPAPEGYRVFHRLDGQSYDYASPAWQGPEVLTPYLEIGTPSMPAPAIPVLEGASFDKLASTVFIDWNQPAVSPATQVDFWVVRAYEGTLESIDSEEVSWTQELSPTIVRWEIFHGPTADGPWTSLGQVAADAPTRVTQPIDFVSPGQKEDVYFTVIAFGDDDQFSANAVPTMVTIDRQLPQPPSGITIEAQVPVQ